MNRKIINSIASHNGIKQRNNKKEKINSIIMNNVVKRNFITKNDAVHFLKNIANHSPLEHHWKINGTLANENMIERLMRTTTKDPKKHPGDQGIEYSEYYNDNSAEPSKTQSKRDETMFENDRIIRQTANNSIFNNFNKFDDHLQYKKLFTDNDNSYDKDLIYNDDSLKPWETNHSVVAQSDNAIDNAFTRLPALIDQKLHPNNPHHIRSNQKDSISNQISNIEKPKENIFVNEMEFLTGNSVISNLDVTQIFNTSEKPIFDSQIDVKQIPEALQYQTELNVPHLYSNLSLDSKMNKLGETGEDTELYYLDMKDAESSINAPHIFRKVPGTLNLYVGRNVEPVVSAVSNEYEYYPAIFTEQPLHKVIFSQSVISNRPIEHILSPDREKNNRIEQDQHEYDQTQLMIEKNQKMIENLSKQYKNDNDKICNETIMKGEDMKSQHANISITLNETKEVANQILGKIIDELEEIKTNQAIENEQIEGYYIKCLKIFTLNKSRFFFCVIYKT